MATVNLLKNLTRLEISIDLLCLVAPNEKVNIEQARNELKVRAVHLVHRPMPKNGLRRNLSWLGSLFRDSKLPLTLSDYASDDVRERFRSILNLQEWDYAVYDGLHSAAPSYTNGVYQKPLSLKSVVYRAHNFESELWEKSARTLPLRQLIRKMMLRHQRAQVRRFETSLAQASAWVASVSDSDARQFKVIAPKTRTSVIPIGIDFDPEKGPSLLPLNPTTRTTSLILLFVGKLDWHPNAQGLKWFLEEVWPNLARARGDVKLWIAGSGNASGLRSSFNQPRVHFWGRVDDLRPLYQACCASIIPLLYGSGTRVKAIESCRYGRVCISTRVGVEGLALSPHQTYLPAETSQEWLQLLTELSPKTCLRLGQNAFEFVREWHDGGKIAQKWIHESDVSIKTS